MAEAWDVPAEEFVGKTNADIHIDPTLADACMDRLVHNSYRLELEGDSLRRDLPVTAQVPSIPPP